MISPADHWCDLDDLVFSHITLGHVWCQECNRVWERQQVNASWRMFPKAYGNWRTLPGNRFTHRLTGEIVEGPPLPAAGAERLAAEMENGPVLADRPARNFVPVRGNGGNDTRL